MRSRFSAALAAVAVLSLVSQARADDELVLVQVKQGKDSTVEVAIHTVDPAYARSAVSLDEAVKTIADMRGFGHVGIYVVDEAGLRGDDLKRLLGAVIDNPRVDLEFFGHKVPKAAADRFPAESKK